MQNYNPLIVKISESILKSWNENLDLSKVELSEEFSIITNDDVEIENYVWTSEKFRKIHLEVARMKSGLNILHTNMYPKYEYDIPIFGADIVASNNGVGAAIVDISSIRDDRSLPEMYNILDILDREFEEDKRMPEWGGVFSKYCVFVKPNEDEYQKFINLVFTYLNYHCAISNITEKGNNIIENFNGHKFYCEQQRKNDKTRGVLKSIFGEEFADKYISEVLFDYPDPWKNQEEPK